VAEKQKPPSGKRELKIPRRARFKPPSESLEDYIEAFKMSPKEMFKDSGSCVKARGFPKDLHLFVKGRLRLSYLKDWPRKSSAIMYRILIHCSISDSEDLLRGYSQFSDTLYRSFDEQPRDRRDKAESQSPKLTKAQLGWGEDTISSSKNIYTYSDDESSRIHTLSDNTGFSERDILVLIINMSLLKANDKEIIPEWVRRECKKCIQEFKKKIKGGKS